jgi:hypothetical protein
MMFGIYASRIKFTRAHARILRKQNLTETEPGSIVHDFNALLDYVQRRRLRVTSGQHQLSLSSLAEINARLQYPLELGLKRPQQKSYPPIHGLYLLLRASGLTYLDESRATPYLEVDEGQVNEWESLNPAERYGTLLEIWLLRGHAEIVGERARPYQRLPVNYENWVNFFGRMAKGEVAESDLDYLIYTPGWHNLGLLDLFGLIEVERGIPTAGKGWQITRIRRTRFGEVLLAALFKACFSSSDWLTSISARDIIPTGTLQSVLQPYFPPWQRTLSLPTEPGYREGIHVVKVTLWQDIWRRLAIPGDLTLDGMASAILDAYEFDHDHLYAFQYETRQGTQQWIRHPFMEEEPTTADVFVGDLSLHVGQTMIFLFDFGDCWEFSVTLEAIEPPNTKSDYPRVLDAHGQAPEQYPR